MSTSPEFDPTPGEVPEPVGRRLDVIAGAVDALEQAAGA